MKATTRGTETGLLEGRHLDLDVAVACSLAVASRVRESGFIPDVVVGIREGGILPARVIADALGARCEMISVRRRMSFLKHQRAVRVLARYLGEYFQQFYRMRRLMRMVNKVPGRTIDRRGDGLGVTPASKILLVDDFSYSGETLLAAGRHLEACGASGQNIRTAAIVAIASATAGRIYRPTYALAEQVWVYFPWSTNSDHYAAYVRWKTAAGIG